MKIVVFSDSHGCVDRMYYICMQEKTDLVIHLGDTVRDAEDLERMLPTTPICSIRGNNDRLLSAPEEFIYKVNDVSLFLCHGHKYAVKQTKTILANSAQAKGCSVALFGHTHRAFDEVVNGIRLLNPGSVTFERTYLRIISDEHGFFPEIISL